MGYIVICRVEGARGFLKQMGARRGLGFRV